MQWRVLTLLLLIAQPLSAGEVKHLAVQHEKGIYHLDLDALIDAEQSVIWSIVTDYDHLDRLNEIFAESDTLLQEDPIKKRRILIKACILFFCIESRLVEDVEESDNKLILAVVDTTQSDFQSGTSHWQILPEGRNQTRILLQSQIKPAFWIPPIIGPILIKHKLHSAARQTIKNLELIAADG